MNTTETSTAQAPGGSGNEANAGTSPPVVTPAPVTSPPAAAPAVDAAALGQFRDAIVAANPQAVSELIRGSSFAEIQASVEGAKAAYARIAASVGGHAQANGTQAAGATAPPVAVAPHVPAGGGAGVDTSSLPPVEKIKAGLAQRAQAG